VLIDPVRGSVTT